MSIVMHSLSNIFEAFVEDFLNVFCMGVSRDMRSVSAPFPIEQSNHAAEAN